MLVSIIASQIYNMPPEVQAFERRVELIGRLRKWLPSQLRVLTTPLHARVAELRSASDRVLATEANTAARYRHDRVRKSGGDAIVNGTII